jgi:DNA primase
VARAIEAGVGEAVASCGTAMTAAHARLMHRFSERVIVNFDQDEAGRKATLKSLEILTEEGLEVRVVSLPEGHDPDTYLREAGADAYRERLGSAPVYMEWLIERAAAENDTKTPQGKAAYLNALLPALQRIESAVERAAWLPRVAAAGGLDTAATEQELRRAVSLRQKAPDAAPVRVVRPAGTLTPAEKWLLTLILQEVEGVPEALTELQDEDLTGLRAAPILNAAKSLLQKGQPVTAAALAEAAPGEEERRMLREIAVAAPQGERSTPLGCVLQLRRSRLERRLKSIQADLEEKRARGEQDLALSQEKVKLARELSTL